MLSSHPRSIQSGGSSCSKFEVHVLKRCSALFWLLTGACGAVGTPRSSKESRRQQLVLAFDTAAERERVARSAWSNHWDSGRKAFGTLAEDVQNALASTDIVYGYFLGKESASPGPHGTFDVQVRIRVTDVLFGELVAGDEIVVRDLCLAEDCSSPGRDEQELLFHIQNVRCRPQLIAEVSRAQASLHENELLGLISGRANLPMRVWADRNTHLWEELNCAELETQRLFEEGA